jgi:PAS domain S-box-containing protein
VILKLKSVEFALPENFSAVVNWARRAVTARDARDLCLFEVAFLISYRYGMSFTQEVASPFWFPAAVQLCALLVVPPRKWWIYLLAPLPVRALVAVPADMPWWGLLAYYLNDTFKAVACALPMRKLLRPPTRFDQLRDFALFLFIAVLVVPFISSFGGAGARHALGYPFWPAFGQWFFGNALANLVLTPAILYWVFTGRESLRGLSWQQMLEVALAVLGLLAAGYFAFWPGLREAYQIPARLYLPIPFLVWIAIRFGLRGASAGLAIIALLAILGALAGKGPFASLGAGRNVLSIQLFLFVVGIPTFLLAALSVEMNQAERSLREAADAVRESETRFRTVADSAPVLIWMAGPDKSFTFFNQSWLKFTGSPLEAELGHGWSRGMHPDDLPRWTEAYNKAFDTRKPFALEYRFKRHDGEYRWIHNEGVPRHDAHHSFVGYIGSCQDFTERKRAESQARSRFAEQAHMARLATMGQLSAALAHELNHPLAAILSNAQAGEMLLSATPPALDEVRRILGDVVRDNRRATEIIKRLRAFLKNRDLAFEPLDMNAVVTETLPLAQLDAAGHINLRLRLGPRLPKVRGDRVHLQQVLLNLLLNAMDAMKALPERAAELRIETRADEGGMVGVCVRDSGPGIPADRLKNVFKPFITTKPQGMGMGLSISHTIIEAHGGRIWAENAPAGGAILRFTVPEWEPETQDVKRSA